MYKGRMGSEYLMSWSVSLGECKLKAEPYIKQEKLGTKGYMISLCAQHKCRAHANFLTNNLKSIKQVKLPSFDPREKSSRDS